MTGVAVYVTELPLQTGFDEAAIVTLTALSVLTVSVMMFEVAGLPDLQVSLEVSVHLTELPFTGVNE